jgi:hypothetical protein
MFVITYEKLRLPSSHSCQENELCREVGLIFLIGTWD